MTAENQHIYESSLWDCGPLLQVHLFLASRNIQEYDPQLVEQFVRQLGLGVMFETIDDLIAKQPYHGDWRKLRSARSTWQLTDDMTVGGKLFLREAPSREIVSSIPPRFVKRFFGAFPWYDNPSDSIMELHRIIIRRILAAHKVIPLRAAMIQEESWLCSLNDNFDGIFIAPNIYLAGEFYRDPDELLMVRQLPDGP